MAKIIGYMVHDAVTNMEWQLENFDQAAVAGLESSGLIIVAVYDDDSRAIVHAADVTEPEPQVNGITLVTPAYVDNRTAATAAVFDALVAIIDPESAVATADETGEEAATAADPVETFKAALTALKALESKKEAEVG